MSVNIQTSSGLVKIAGTPTIDTTLSNVSKNPVQNKVVTEKFGEINRNLEQLEYGEKSGSKNIYKWQNTNGTSNGINISLYKNNVTLKGTTTTGWGAVPLSNPITLDEGTYIGSNSIGYTQSNLYLHGKNSNGNNVDINLKSTTPITLTETITFTDIFYSGLSINLTLDVDMDIMIEVGSVVSNYEAYIPSLSMLEERSDSINASLDNLSKGGINLACNFMQGGIVGNVGSQYITNNISNRCRTDKRYLSDVTSIIPLSIPSSYRVGITSYNSSNVMIADSGWLTGTVDYELVENTYYITIVVSKTDNTDITPQVVEQLGIKALVYNFGEEIDNLKNDLSNKPLNSYYGIIANGSTLSIDKKDYMDIVVCRTSTSSYGHYLVDGSSDTLVKLTDLSSVSVSISDGKVNIQNSLGAALRVACTMANY